jgi:LacI family transcriptional regulator
VTRPDHGPERGPEQGPDHRPTHRDIARLARTSQATVSLVLNNRASALRISEKTRDAVLAAARDLGYVPDLGARRLRHHLGTSTAPDLILAVLRPASTRLGNATFVVEAAQAALAALPGGPTRSQLVLEEFLPGRLAEHPGIVGGARFHGAIVTGMTPEDERAFAAGVPSVPLVAFQRRAPGRAYVDVDNVRGGALVTRHLLASGRRRIAALGYAFPPSRAQDERLEGARQALTAARMGGEGGERAEARVERAATADPAPAAETAARLLRDWRPDAVFALSDVLAVGVLHALRAAAMRVPEDVAVVGYDDFPYAPFLDPPLTSVRLPYEAMGRAAVGWLTAAAHAQAPGLLQQVYAPELIVRRSS